MSDTDQRGRLVHNEQLNPAKAGFKRSGGSGARYFAASPFGLLGLIFFIGWVTNCIPAHRLSLFRPLLPATALDRVEESLDYSAVFL